MAQCGDVIASQGDQLITFDLPTHGNCQDDKAFNPIEASPEVRMFAQLAHSQSTEIGLRAHSIRAYFSLCDTPLPGPSSAFGWCRHFLTSSTTSRT